MSDPQLPHHRLPAEWEPQDAVMIAWPHDLTDWNYMLDEVTECYRQLVAALADKLDVVIVGPGVDKLAGTPVLPESPRHRIILRNVPTNDTWARDFGPITVEFEGDPLPLDFTFNGWGLKFAADKDNLVTSRLDAGGLFARSPENCRGFVLEGGSIESDGCGTLLTTSECLLSPNRNPQLTKSDIEAYLCSTLGAKRVLWLDHGYLAGDDTDSHVDTLARFAPDSTIIYVAPPEDSSDEHFEALSRMQEQIRSLRTPDGSPYNLIALPMADAVFDKDGNRLPATYANFLATNGAVLVPSYGSPRKDRLAADMIRIAFPDREIIQVDCRALIRQHGSLHCATMQLPRHTLAR